MTRWRSTSVITMPQRTGRIQLRIGHKIRASTRAAYPSIGVLELQVITITVDETMPAAIATRYFLFFCHNPTKSGTRMAPKVPARMGWEKQPVARNLLSRSMMLAYAAAFAPPRNAYGL